MWSFPSGKHKRRYSEICLRGFASIPWFNVVTNVLQNIFCCVLHKFLHPKWGKHYRFRVNCRFNIKFYVWVYLKTLHIPITFTQWLRTRIHSNQASKRTPSPQCKHCLHVWQTPRSALKLLRAAAELFSQWSDVPLPPSTQTPSRPETQRPIHTGARPIGCRREAGAVCDE